VEVFRQSVQDVLERVDIRRCRRSWADRKPTTPAQPNRDSAPHAFQSSSGIPPAPPAQFKTDKKSIGITLYTFNPCAAGRLGGQVSEPWVSREVETATASLFSVKDHECALAEPRGWEAPKLDPAFFSS